ncbi:hypothetical protein Scep_019253 [Stephania cephalantha]|uniref:Uncharacterized protein n=1 Tax=Stephania cephalantha TaxID=152367 RepID=A0AAP0IAG4_9MAGN
MDKRQKGTALWFELMDEWHWAIVMWFESMVKWQRAIVLRFETIDELQRETWYVMVLQFESMDEWLWVTVLQFESMDEWRIPAEIPNGEWNGEKNFSMEIPHPCKKLHENPHRDPQWGMKLVKYFTYGDSPYPRGFDGYRDEYENSTPDGHGLGHVAGVDWLSSAISLTWQTRIGGVDVVGEWRVNTWHARLGKKTLKESPNLGVSAAGHLKDDQRLWINENPTCELVEDSAAQILREVQVHLFLI